MEITIKILNDKINEYIKKSNEYRHIDQNRCTYFKGKARGLIELKRELFNQDEMIIKMIEERNRMSELNEVVCPYCDGACEPSTCPKYLAYKKVQEPGAIEAKLTEMGIDPTNEKFAVMMSMQKIFAERFHKIDGLTKDEIDKWMLAYDSCITDEVTEAFEHLSVLPGIIAKEDHYELQKEFIDIWHFLMDAFLVGGMTPETVVKAYETEFGEISNNQAFLDAVFMREVNNLNSMYNGQLHSMDKGEIDNTILVQSALILLGMSKVRKEISWKHWKKPAEIINFDKLYSALVQVMQYLVRCFILTGLTAESLTEIYITKNCENVFRQELGY